MASLIVALGFLPWRAIIAFEIVDISLPEAIEPELLAGSVPAEPEWSGRV